MKIYITRHSEGLELSTMDKGYRVARLYVGYSVKEAKSLFRQFVKAGN